MNGTSLPPPTAQRHKDEPGRWILEVRMDRDAGPLADASMKFSSACADAWRRTRRVCVAPPKFPSNMRRTLCRTPNSGIVIKLSVGNKAQLASVKLRCTRRTKRRDVRRNRDAERAFDPSVDPRAREVGPGLAITVEPRILACTDPTVRGVTKAGNPPNKLHRKSKGVARQDWSGKIVPTASEIVLTPAAPDSLRFD